MMSPLLCFPPWSISHSKSDLPFQLTQISPRAFFLFSHYKIESFFEYRTFLFFFGPFVFCSFLKQPGVFSRRSSPRLRATPPPLILFSFPLLLRQGDFWGLPTGNYLQKNRVFPFSFVARSPQRLLFPDGTIGSCSSLDGPLPS